MKTILLTGSEGYIAKNFKQQYKDKFNFINVDKKTGTEILGIDIPRRVDYIVHLAAISGIAACEKDKEQTIMDNVTSTLHLIRYSSILGIPIVFASSQGAKEPDNLYSITKRICEIEAHCYRNINVLRFANVYGGVDYLKTKTSVVSQFLNAALDSKPLIINGDGNQMRDFIHIDDVSRAIYESLDKRLVAPIDVGTGYGTSISLLANMISTNIIYGQNRSIGVDSSIADTTGIKKHLGFKPKSSKLIEYVDSILVR